MLRLLFVLFFFVCFFFSLFLQIASLRAVMLRHSNSTTARLPSLCCRNPALDPTPSSQAAQPCMYRNPLVSSFCCSGGMQCNCTHGCCLSLGFALGLPLTLCVHTCDIAHSSISVLCVQSTVEVLLAWLMLRVCCTKHPSNPPKYLNEPSALSSSFSNNCCSLHLSAFSQPQTQL